MFLITELTEDVKYLVEEKDNKKSLYIEGIFAQSEIKNRNGRVYPKAVLESAINTYIHEKVKNRSAYGELSHPTSPKINEDRISHLIESLKWTGNDVYGRAKILETPMGNIARAIIDGGGKIAVSTRGMGSVKPNSMGIVEVQNDYKIATAADLVVDPSVSAAFVNGILEGVEFSYDSKNGWFQKEIENIKTEIHAIPKKRLEQHRMRLFENFLRKVSSES